LSVSDLSRSSPYRATIQINPETLPAKNELTALPTNFSSQYRVRIMDGSKKEFE